MDQQPWRVVEIRYAVVVSCYNVNRNKSNVNDNDNDNDDDDDDDDDDDNNVLSLTIKSHPYRKLPFMEVKKMFLFMNWSREEILQVSMKLRYQVRLHKKYKSNN